MIRKLKSKSGYAEYISLSIIVVVMAFMATFLVGFRQLSSSLNGMTELLSVAGRSAAVAESEEEANERVEAVINSAAADTRLRDVTYSITYANAEEDSWTLGTRICIEVSAYVSTITPFTSGRHTRTTLVSIEGVAADNSTIANAAMSMLAKPTEARGSSEYDTAPAVYRRVWDSILGGSGYAHLTGACCDCFATCAVRWSGSDDNFPQGIDAAMAYCEMSDRWAKVLEIEDLPCSEAALLMTGRLMPGDILIQPENRHIAIWVGTEAALEFFGDEYSAYNPSNLNVVSASNSGDLGGGVRDINLAYWGTFSGWYSDTSTYVYRCINPQAGDSIYADIF